MKAWVHGQLALPPGAVVRWRTTALCVWRNKLFILWQPHRERWEKEHQGPNIPLHMNRKLSTRPNMFKVPLLPSSTSGWRGLYPWVFGVHLPKSQQPSIFTEKLVGWWDGELLPVTYLQVWGCSTGLLPSSRISRHVLLAVQKVRF